MEVFIAEPSHLSSTTGYDVLSDPTLSRIMAGSGSQVQMANSSFPLVSLGWFFFVSGLVQQLAEGRTQHLI
jgi:hypothetical protein